MNALAALGFLLSGAAFGLLAAWSCYAWRGRPHVVLLSTAAAISAGYSFALCALIVFKLGSALLLESLELLRSAAWSLLLARAIRSRMHAPTSLRPGAGLSFSWMTALYALLAATLLLLHGAPQLLEHRHASSIRAAGYLLASIAGLSLVEQLYRSTPREDRWAVKFACLGLGAFFAYDFYLYSDAALFGKLDARRLAASGFVDVLAAPLIALSFSRNPAWANGLVISRRALFRSTAVLGAACYMLAMAAAGYVIRVEGGVWGPSLQLAFLVGALTLLVAIMGSGTARAWLRVVIAKHFYRYSYDYREEWLRFTRTLSQEGPSLPIRVIQAIAAMVDSPGGSLWLIDERCFQQKARWNVPAIDDREPSGSALCELMRRHQWILDLDRPKAMPSGAAPVALPAWLTADPTARIVVPLGLRGKLCGFIVLMQPRSHLALDWEAFDLLRAASSQAASYLGEQQATEALLVARQFESISRMSAFIAHDLKSLVSQLSLAVENSVHHLDNPEFRSELVCTLTHSVERMRVLMQRLHHGRTPETSSAVALDDIVMKAVAEKAALKPKPAAELIDSGIFVLADAALLARIVGHLLQNAIEATANGGWVRIRLFRNQDRAVVEVIDTGHGMNPDFVRDKLFKPFITSKPAGMGIGVFESRMYVQRLGGTLEVDSRPSLGSTFRIILPIHFCEGVTIENAA